MFTAASARRFANPYKRDGLPSISGPLTRPGALPSILFHPSFISAFGCNTGNLVTLTLPQDDAGPARQAAASLRARLRIKSMQLYKEERRGLMGPQRQAYAAELRERQRGDG